MATKLTFVQICKYCQ